MTHKPPMPDAAVSPYPLAPEPTPDTPVEKTANGAAAHDGEANAHRVRNIGIAAGAAIGSAAVAAALIYYNRPATPAKRATPKPAAKRASKTATPKATTAKAATAKTAKPRSTAAKPTDKVATKAAPKTAAKTAAKPRAKAKPTDTSAN